MRPDVPPSVTSRWLVPSVALGCASVFALVLAAVLVLVPSLARPLEARQAEPLVDRNADASGLSWPVIAEPVKVGETRHTFTRFGWCSPQSDGCYLPWDEDSTIETTYRLGEYELEATEHLREPASAGAELVLSSPGRPDPGDRGYLFAQAKPSTVRLRSDGVRTAVTAERWFLPDGVVTLTPAAGGDVNGRPVHGGILATGALAVALLGTGAALGRCARRLGRTPAREPSHDEGHAEHPYRAALTPVADATLADCRARRAARISAVLIAAACVTSLIVLGVVAS